jgi:hypothetical protein
MSARSLRPTRAALALAGAVATLGMALAGCGQSDGQHTPDLAQLPLVQGTRVLLRVRTCDPGANAFCAWELVVAGDHFRSSEALMNAEHHHLRLLGWTSANADTGNQDAQDSPGHKLRVTYATPLSDLQNVEVWGVKRAPQIQHALSTVMFARTPALSILYELGAS